jgi:hypothetical protein
MGHKVAPDWGNKKTYLLKTSHGSKPFDFKKQVMADQEGSANILKDTQPKWIGQLLGIKDSIKFSWHFLMVTRRLFYGSPSAGSEVGTFSPLSELLELCWNLAVRYTFLESCENIGENNWMLIVTFTSLCWNFF